MLVAAAQSWRLDTATASLDPSTAAQSASADWDDRGQVNGADNGGV